MNNICLISIIPSHYRLGIYTLMDEKLKCDFIFGEENTTVKKLDTNALRNAVTLKNKHIFNSPFYHQKGLVAQTRQYDTLILDLGIHCLTSWIIIILSKFRKQKIYLWDHGWYGRETLLKKMLKKLYFGSVKGAFLYGNYAKILMVENGFAENKLHVIHNSLDYEKQLRIRNRIKPSSIFKDYFQNENPVIIMIGRLTKPKRIDLLLHTLAQLKAKGEQYNAVIIGDGDERDSLEHLSHSLNIAKQIWFTGAIYDEQKNAELLYNADLCAVPGAVGLTAIHAMMFGVPVISNNDFPNQMPEFEAIVEGTTGCFFKANDIHDFTQKISNWFKNNPKNREEIRNACFKEIDEQWNPLFQIRVMQQILNP